MKGQTRPGDQINTVLDQAFCAGLARSAYIFLFRLHLDNDLERVGAGRTAERVIGTKNIVKPEMMSNQFLRVDLSGRQGPQQHWGGNGNDQPRGAVISWQNSNVAGTPTASITGSTPLPSVRSRIRAAASGSSALMVRVAPTCLAVSSR